ncbi:hypothetical protein LCGC14_0319590 [marine sediment metagenome]|uniref:Uncharacterized protein n=1 Tax=marine sediment metagenome TaxID=412755 RepID=A0A0F9W6R6_9ZZZZ
MTVQHGDTIPDAHKERWCEIHGQSHPAHHICCHYGDAIIADIIRDGPFNDSDSLTVDRTFPDFQTVLAAARDHDRIAKFLLDEWPDVIAGSAADTVVPLLAEYRSLRQVAEITGRLVDNPMSVTNIRPDIREALDNYAKKRWPTGQFLSAVLSNDLKGATGHADADNIRVLPAIVSYIYNDLPAPCWGSKEEVVAWLAARCKTCNGTGTTPDHDENDPLSKCTECDGKGHQ